VGAAKDKLVPNAKSRLRVNRRDTSFFMISFLLTRF